MIDKDN